MKILVVDDEKDIQTLFQQRFRKEIKSETWGEKETWINTTVESELHLVSVWIRSKCLNGVKCVNVYMCMCTCGIIVELSVYVDMWDGHV